MSKIKPSTEPVVYATVVQAVLGGLVATGWVTLPDTAIKAYASVVGVILAVVAGWITRSKVTPKPNLVVTTPNTDELTTKVAPQDLVPPVNPRAD